MSGGNERRDVAWLAAMPCALVLVAAVVVLGPPLGRALLDPRPPTFWPSLVKGGALSPEPTEHARYLLALLGPVLLSGVVLLAASRRWSRSIATDALVQLSQALLLAGAIGSVVAQHLTASLYDERGAQAYFSWRTLEVAAVVALVVVALLQRRSLVARIAAATRETLGRRVGAIVLALLLTATWLLAAFNTEGSIGTTNIALAVNVPFWLDETFAVLNGRAPLATFHAQYSQLWPYLSAGVMSLVGTSFTVYAAVMVSGAGAAVLAVFAILRRIVKSSLLALALYVPFVATSFFTEQGPLENRWGPVNSFSMFPMRYGGAYLLAWLMVRHVDGARPRRRVALFTAAGLVAINNVEFGIPALAATLAGVVWTAGRPTRRSSARLVVDVTLGVLAAAALTSLLTLAVAGSLPDFGTLFLFSKIYVAGFGNLPISPAIGVYLTLYATFAAAIVVATVRALDARDDRALTGMLVWSGVFGLGTGGYYVGRSHPDVLISLFSPWALAIVLLVVVAVRSMLARPTRLPALAELAPLLGVGIALCSIGQTPIPGQEVDRIGRSTGTPVFRPLGQEHVIAEQTRAGEHVAILGPLGHRIAYDLGIADVVPYATLESMPTLELFHAMIGQLRAEGISKVFLILVATTHQEHVDALRRAGFTPLHQTEDVMELVRRH